MNICHCLHYLERRYRWPFFWTLETRGFWDVSSVSISFAAPCLHATVVRVEHNLDL